MKEVLAQGKCYHGLYVLSADPQVQSFLFNIKIKALMKCGIPYWVTLHLILFHYYVIWDIWRFMPFYQNRLYLHHVN